MCYLIRMGADVNLCGGVYGNALQAAAADPKHRPVEWMYLPKEFSKYPKVEALLNPGASVNMVGGRYGTALQAAALDGSDDVVKLLLSYGADVDVEGGEYGSALKAAVCVGARTSLESNTHPELSPEDCYRNGVRLLLDHGAKVDEDVMTAARDSSDEHILSMLQECFENSAVKEKDEICGMFGTLFD